MPRTRSSTLLRRSRTVSHTTAVREQMEVFFLIEYTRLEKKHKDCNKEIQRKMVILASKAMIISDTFGMGHLLAIFFF